jgi:hypothetical protein
MAKKRTFMKMEPGDLVAIKKPKFAHFDLGASGPCIIIEDLGDSVKVKNMNGRVTTHNKANCIRLKASYAKN